MREEKGEKKITTWRWTRPAKERSRIAGRGGEAGLAWHVRRSRLDEDGMRLASGAGAGPSVSPG